MLGKKKPSKAVAPPTSAAPAPPKKTWGRKAKKPVSKFPVEEAIFNPENPHLPPLFTKCVAYLEKNALDLEGIFRVSGSVARVKLLKERFDKGEDVNIDEILEQHCVSGTLKLFLRELTDPVCTFELYDCFLAGASVPVRSNRIACLRKVIELLPPGNFNLLKQFIGLLKKIHDHSEVNMMKASNLSIVFAPTLLRSKNETQDSMVTDMNASNSLVEIFILDFEEIFNGKELEEEVSHHVDVGDAPPPQILDAPDRPLSVSSLPPSLSEPSSSSLSLPPSSPPLPSPSLAPSSPQSRAKPICFVRGLWDFEAELPDEISFAAGTVISVIQKDGDKEGFWRGEFFLNESDPSLTSPVPTPNFTVERLGWFQSDFVEEIQFDVTPSKSASQHGVTDTHNGIVPPHQNAAADHISESSIPKSGSTPAGSSSATPPQFDRSVSSIPSFHQEAGKGSDKPDDFNRRMSLNMSSAPAGSDQESRVVCRAKWDFTAPADKAGLLSFKRGDVIVVWKKGKEGGWWAGHLNGKAGHFPVSYTEVFSVPVSGRGSWNLGNFSGLSIPPPLSQPGISASQSGASGSTQNVPSLSVTAPSSGGGAPVTPSGSNRNFERMLKIARQNRESQMVFNPQDLKEKMEKARLEEEKRQKEEEEEEGEGESPEEEEEESEGSHIKKPSDSPINEGSKTDTLKEEASSVEAETPQIDDNTSKAAAAPATEGLEEWVEAIYDYVRTPDTPELSFSVGDKMRVLRKFASGWMEAELSGSKGFIPGTYVEACSPP